MTWSRGSRSRIDAMTSSRIRPDMLHLLRCCWPGKWLRPESRRPRRDPYAVLHRSRGLASWRATTVAGDHPGSPRRVRHGRLPVAHARGHAGVAARRGPGIRDAHAERDARHAIADAVAVRLADP